MNAGRQMRESAQRSADRAAARLSKKHSAERAQHDVDLSGLAASMGHKPLTHQQAKLAAEFARVLHEWLTPQEMAAAVATNEARELEARAKGEKCQTCATHDYCDANMAMDEAMENLKMPRDGDPDEAGWGEHWNAAWGFAKTMNFDAEYLSHYANTMF